MGTGEGTERASRLERNRTRNGVRESPAKAGHEVEGEDENLNAGRGCAGVLGVIHGGGSR